MADYLSNKEAREKLVDRLRENGVPKEKARDLAEGSVRRVDTTKQREGK